MDPILRAFDARLEVIAGERAVVAKINTDAVDRYSTVIDPSGVDLANYRKHPVVLVNHGQENEGMPVGRAAWIKYIKAERAIVAKTIFFEDEFSDRLFRMAQDGVMNAYSVRVVPLEYSSPTPDEIRKRPELADCYLIYRKCDLAEYSIVNVPGNPEALALAVSRGLILPDRLVPETGTEAETQSDREPEPIPEPELPRLNCRRTLCQGVLAGIDHLRRSVPGEAARATRDRLDLLRGKV